MSGKLEEYRRKRDFVKTSEPRGKIDVKAKQKSKDASTKTRRSTKVYGGRYKTGDFAKQKQGRFVVQLHYARRKHYDFRLEFDGVLLSWALPKGPSFNPKDKRLAVRVEDHPIEYANFEGIIPKGEYGGGTVMLWDKGEYIAEEDFAKGLEKGSLKFTLKGKRLKGKWTLVRMATENEKKENWLFIKEKDEFVRAESGISQFANSVASGRTIDEIAEGKKGKVDKKQLKNPFDNVNVMLAQLSMKVPTGKDFVYEIKYDGYRVVAFIEGGKARLVTRNGNDITSKFKDIASSLEKQAAERSVVLDGEIIAADDQGRPDFQALQNLMKSKNAYSNLVYIVFDMLAIAGQDLREKQLLERKKLLKSFLKDCSNNIQYASHIDSKGEEFFNAVNNMGLEGVVAKKKSSTYSGSRNGDWIKIKCYKRQEFVIGGYTSTGKKGISSLLLGVYKNENLVYVGRTGTGFGESQISSLLKNFKKLAAIKNPFVELFEARKEEQTYFLKPTLIAEVQYVEFTKDGLLRQASFKGLREDKNPKEVVFEEDFALDVPKSTQKSGKNNEKPEKPHKMTEKMSNKKVNQTSSNKSTFQSNLKKDFKAELSNLEISNPDKLLYTSPKVQKIDLFNYYKKVCDRMLPYVSNRLLSVVRCHDKASASCFYKKHPTTKNEAAKVVTLTNDEGEKSEYFYINSPLDLLSQVQLGTIEFHIWGSKVESLEKPDFMVFDLDPDKGVPLSQVRQGVKDLKKILDKLKLKSFLKTSGGKGYHIVVPFSRTANWQVFHDFAENVALLMEQKWPSRYTSNIRKASRKGKIFVDYMRNGRGSTSVAPYSLRAREGAKISMPIAWSELDKIAPDGVDIFEAQRRINKKDPWKGFYTINQVLE